MKIVTAAQMKRAEEESARRGVPTGVLMENAGKAVAEAVRTILGDVAGKHILFFIGPGNNGGDGLVAARQLFSRGAKIELYTLGRRPVGDSLLSNARNDGILTIPASENGDLKKLADILSHSDAVVDAVLGTGRNRPLEGVFASAFAMLNREKQKRFSLKVIGLDIPTGLDADTGAIDPNTPISDYTITLGFPKPGLFNMPGAERAGKIIIVGIGIPEGAAVESCGEYLEPGEMKKLLPLRSPFANKGTFGKALVVAGSVNYVGAAYLASSAAMRSGSGLTTLAIAKTLQPVLASKLTETTYLPLSEAEAGVVSPASVEVIKGALSDYDALLVGPGLGQRPPAVEFMHSLFDFLKAVDIKIILDADALNTLAQTSDWWRDLTCDAILTPHPGEMARLTGMSVESIQHNRLETAREAAQKWHKTVVLKGAYTVIAAPDGRLAVSPFANAGLASAGTGDVLAGAISGLAAQGLSLFDAACLGVFLHGLAGEIVKDNLGDAGMLASDLLPVLPLAIKKLKEGI